MSGNVIVDCLEFLYRNYVHNNWMASAWRRGRSRASSTYDTEKDLFNHIVQAFPDAHFRMLEQLAQMSGRMKQVHEQPWTLVRRQHDRFGPAAPQISCRAIRRVKLDQDK